MDSKRLTNEIASLARDDQALLAQSMSTQALLSALYAKCLNMDQVWQDFSEGRHSLVNVFDERGRLRVLIEKFGEMMLAVTDTQFDKGERSNGWHDVSRTHMRDIVIENLIQSLSSAMQIRMTTKHLESEESS